MKYRNELQLQRLSARAVKREIDGLKNAKVLKCGFDVYFSQRWWYNGKLRELPLTLQRRPAFGFRQCFLIKCELGIAYRAPDVHGVVYRACVVRVFDWC